MIDLPFQTETARYIWESKYRNRERDGSVDGCIEESWQRVAQGVASIEPENGAAWGERFLKILEDFIFLPGGRILAGAGVARDVTLFNCFVMGPVEDSLEGIFAALREGALTMQQGGGIGYDFSSLRPYGTVARRVGGIASGPVSFMRIWDAMCDTLVSTASRRGAMMASLRCDHPDIERFVDAKREPGELRHFNLSVQISDRFVAAVEGDEEWPLLFPEKALSGSSKVGGKVVARCWNEPHHAEPCRVLRIVKARELWERIMRANYDYAEPGVLFIDQINRMNNLRYREWISTTNPCGEIPMPAYGACNLGSLNLTRFVKAPFTKSAAIDYPALEHCVKTAVRFLDDVIDLSRFPLPAQQREAHGTRRIGLGITGLADSLIMLGLHYADTEARETAARIMARVCHTAYRSSIVLAKEKGVFPYFERQAYLQSTFIGSLPEDIQQGIENHGIRNSHLTAIAPAGTISLLANNVSSGIEPVYAFNYRRRIRQASARYRQVDMVDYAWRMWSCLCPDKPLPDCFVTSKALSVHDHLQMQAALQPYVDSAISKTINVATEYPYEAFKSIYRMAFDLGLKGCAAFRPNPVSGEVLSDGNLDGRHCLGNACGVD
ncbi:MAG: adenosylcobalamin-dependent ribonucleoside-diphosphate reductase [Candidatus Thiodiazotropha sp.]